MNGWKDLCTTGTVPDLHIGIFSKGLVKIYLIKITKMSEKLLKIKEYYNLFAKTLLCFL